MKNIFKRVTKTDWQLIGIYYSFLVPFTYVNSSLVGNHEMISWRGLAALGIFTYDYCIDIFVVILVVYWFFHDYFEQKKYFKALYLTAALLLLQRILQPWLIPWLYKDLDENFLLQLVEGIEANFDAIIGPCIFLILKKHYDSKNQVMQLEKEKKESELQLLRAQIDPHFLFNNLNILDILIGIDPKKASRYTKRLSSLYRYMIRHKDQDVVSLKEEWQFSEDYIFLLQQRFDDLYFFDSTLDEESLDQYFIPPASMQTLLENIVKHNFALPDRPIRATIYLEADHLCVQNDNRPKESVKDSTGTGLNNLKKRIELLTDQDLIVEKTATSFLVKVPLVKLV